MYWRGGFLYEIALKHPFYTESLSSVSHFGLGHLPEAPPALSLMMALV